MAPVSTNNPDQMPLGRARFLAVYLTLAALLSVYLVCSLWSAQSTGGWGNPPAANCAGAAGPKLSNLYPKVVDLGSAGADVLVIGCAFPPTTEAKINGSGHAALFVDGSHIRVVLTSADVAAAGTLVITLSNDGTDFGSAVLAVVSPSVYGQSFLIGSWKIPQDLQLLLMVFFTGAFGSCVYALKSLADYRGDNTLYDTWFLFYLIQPLEGAGIGLLLYLVIRGGFLGGTGADARTVNPFGVCAIAGLAGAFSDIAFLKLREVFLTLFKPQDDRGGKIAPLQITTTSLPDGTVGTPYSQPIQTSGGVAPLQWSVTPALPAGLTLDPASGTIGGTPTAPSPKATFIFSVTDSATAPNSGSADLTLAVNAPSPALTIATTQLPDGAVGTPYNQPLQASGGTAPLKWSVSPSLPAGLTLDPASGTISGTPAATLAPTAFTFTVTDSGTPPASPTASVSLQIK